MKFPRARPKMVWVEGTGTDPQGRIEAGRRAKANPDSDTYREWIAAGYVRKIAAPPADNTHPAPPGIHPADPSFGFTRRRRR
jgi:hypothetical protein